MELELAREFAHGIAWATDDAQKSELFHAALKLSDDVIARSVDPRAQLEARLLIIDLVLLFGGDDSAPVTGHLQRAHVLCQKHDFVEERLRLMLVECDVMKHATHARNIVKQGIDECKRRHLNGLLFQFHLRRVQTAENTFNALDDAIQDAQLLHEQQALVLFQLTRALVGLGNGQLISHSLTTNGDDMPTQLKVLDLMVMLLSQLTRGESAINTLGKLHQLVESETYNISDAYFKIRLKDTKVTLKWLQNSHVDALVFLLSGIAVMGESNNAPAKKFILEGAKLVERELSNATINMPWLSKMKQVFYLMLIDSLLTRHQLREAEQMLSELEQYIVDDEVSDVVDQHWLVLAQAQIAQCQGDLRRASDLYMQLVASKDASLSVYASLHLGFIYAGSSERDLEKVKHCVNGLMKRISDGDTHPSFRCAHHLLCGIVALEQSEYHRTKVHLLDALKLCSTSSGSTDSSAKNLYNNAQLKVACLAILGQVYQVTANEQAGKMLASAHSLATKMKSELLACACADLLASIQPK